MSRFLQITLAILIFSCASPEKSAHEIIQRSINVHGCQTFEDATVTFDFRDHSYSVSRNAEGYVYSREKKDSTGLTIDSLFNSTSLKRYKSDSLIPLTSEWQTKYTSSVNSVLYFFQLPCLLNDPAVMLSDAGMTTIEGEKYHQIEVRFSPEGGGEDFEDVYMYWINMASYTLDYLAYNYQVEGGGTRFRKAINRRTVEDLMIQDYINLKPEEKFPPLSTLPDLYQKGELTELSRIINTNVLIH